MVKNISGDLIIPESIPSERTVRAAVKFEAPEELILRGYCTPVENQGDLPYCAAYAATSYAESVLWRKRHYREEIDPIPVYNKAKEIDGHPDVEGTTLEAALQAVIDLGYLDKTKYKVKMFGGKPLGRTDGLKSVKFAVHEHGCCLGGFQLTKEWKSPSWFTNTIQGKDYPLLGGHAVLIVGWDKNKILVMNSWGEKYADGGFVWLTTHAFQKLFVLGAVAEEI